MTQIDLEIVVRKLSNIKKYLDQLQTKEHLSEADSVESFEQQLVVERLLHLLIGSAADINAHIAAINETPPPNTYRESFILLGKMGVISADLAYKIVPAAGLRNRSVHDYDDTDTLIVYRPIALALDLFPQYLAQVQAYLQQNYGRSF